MLTIPWPMAARAMTTIVVIFVAVILDRSNDRAVRPISKAGGTWVCLARRQGRVLEHCVENSEKLGPDRGERARDSPCDSPGGRA